MLKKSTQSIVCIVTVLALSAPLAVRADNTNASAKVTIQTSYKNVLGPFTASTTTVSEKDSGWQPVLVQNIKMANNHDLLITASFEVGLLTSTTVSSKNMVIDTATATASVKVRALVDGVVADPGEVVYGKRTQQLSATLEGAIAGCLSIITNSAGGLQIVLNTNCVAPETISLLDDSVSANSFVFGMQNLSSGWHDIQIQAQIVAKGDNQSGTFQAVGIMQKGTLTAESVRLAKNPAVGYVIPLQ